MDGGWVMMQCERETQNADGMETLVLASLNRGQDGRYISARSEAEGWDRMKRQRT